MRRVPSTRLDLSIPTGALVIPLEGEVWAVPPAALVPDCPVHVRLELDERLRLRGEPSFSVSDSRSGHPSSCTRLVRGEALVWTLSSLPAGTITIEVGSAPGYARVGVTTTVGAEAEPRLRLVPR